MPGGETAAGARSRRPARRGRRGGWRARRARERGGGEQLTAPGIGVPDGPCRVECQPAPPQSRPGTTAALHRGPVGIPNTDRGTKPATRNIGQPTNVPRLTQRRTPPAARPTSLAQSERNQDTDHRARSTRPANGHQLKIGHINAQSLVPKVNVVNTILEAEHFDLLCISETWLTPDTLSRFLVFPGYVMVRKDRAVSSQGHRVRGGGVAIIHREEISCQVLQTPATSLLETLWLSVCWRGGRPAIVGVIYRPPTGSVSQAVEELQEQLQEILIRAKPVVLLGDVNINILDTQSLDTRRYLTCLSELNLNQLIKQPTHLFPTPTALDHAVTNVPSARASVLSTPIGDHQPITVSVPIGRLRKPANERTSRNWGRADWDAICLDLLMSDWTAFETSEDINSMVESFMAIWWSVLDQHCPTRARRSRRRGCPWIRDDLELRWAMAERDRAYKVWKAQRTPESRAHYRHQRNAVKTHLARARREFLDRQLLNSDRREFWSHLRRYYIAPSNSTSTAQRTTSTEQRARADRFNEYFSTVGSRIAADLSDDVTVGVAPRPPIVVSASFKLGPATLPELARAVRQMNSAGAVGPDGVPLSAVKRCFAVIGPYLLRIVNKSLTTGVFPEAWKIAEVVPIPKSKGGSNDPSSHRPISLLSHLSKLLEKVVCNQLTQYLTDNDILYQRQYAYRRGHSTEDAMLDAVEWISQNQERGEVTSIATVDLSKAFDSVDHGVLLSKLGWYGIDSTWFQSYLDGRRQLVRGGETVHPVRFGVPQGSIAGPVLFSLFINDLHCHLPECRVISYADDTQLFNHSLPDPKNIASLNEILQKSLEAMQRWYASNSLRMNPDKTDLILVGTRQNIAKVKDFKISVAQSIIEPSSSIKLLGVTVDPHLSWDFHISSVVRKCNAILMSLYRFRDHFSNETLKLIIETHVFPHILYCISVWGGTTKKNMAKIKKLINFGARIVTGVRRRESISPTVTCLGWAQIGELVKKRDLLKVFKAIHNQSTPISIRRMFVPRSEVSSRVTRSVEAGAIENQKCRLSSTRRAFRYRAIALWNQLPPAVTSQPTLAAFQAALNAL